jgi:hypothetical protein
MRAFKPKPFRTIESEAGDKHGLTDEQHRAMLAEFNRRLLQFRKSWLRCGDKRCRRRQECLGPPFVCNNGAEPPRLKNRQYRRLRRDLFRKPPQV